MQLLIYFPIYLYLKRSYDPKYTFLFGSISGATANFLCYSLDSAKSIQQRYSINMQQIINRQFIKSCYRGIQYQLAKSFVSHGLTFYIFVKSNIYLNKLM